jgi:hypothetical protein
MENSVRVEKDDQAGEGTGNEESILEWRNGALFR